ncbi:MAG: indolepyruvate oxidoreductase, partial [Deltaproteobacteria bacterium]
MKKILLGNEAIARGLLENGCVFAASYPGTPASEILSSFLQMARAEKSPALAEWSINEKVAFETALAVSYTGGRAAVSMKQVGLNVACDPLMSSAYTGVKGGFLIISADDPGPHSSQTEQDSRLMALMAKSPVLDPSTPQEAKDLISFAYRISEEFEIPVMVRPTTRVCHA